MVFRCPDRRGGADELTRSVPAHCHTGKTERGGVVVLACTKRSVSHGVKGKKTFGRRTLCAAFNVINFAPSESELPRLDGEKRNREEERERVEGERQRVR